MGRPGPALSGSQPPADVAGRPGKDDGETGAPPRRRGAGSGLLLLLLAYALLVSAFVMTNPPGAASDEPSHFYKAAGLALGQVRGEPGVAADLHPPRSWTPSMTAWIEKTTRTFVLPADIRGCDAFRLPAPTCARPNLATTTDRQASYVGTYLPAAYLPPAAGIRVAESVGLGPVGTVRAARAGGAFVDLALLGVAGRLLLVGWRLRLSVLGLVLTVTPLVVFTMSQVSTSGQEITASICLVSGLLRLTSGQVGRHRRLVWAAVAVAGLLFVTSRPTSPPWCAFVVGLVVLSRPRAAWAAFRTDVRAALAAALVVALGSASTVAWELAFEPSPQVTARQFWRGLPMAVDRLPAVADQTIGRLGWISIPLGRPTVYLWWGMLLALLLTALWLGGWWERAALALGAAGVVALTLLVDAGTQQPASPDFVMQARYVLSAAVVLPLLAADVVRRRLPRPGPAQLEPYLCAGAIGLLLFQLARALVANDTFHRARLARTPFVKPPLGWSFWELVAVVAVGLGLLGAAMLRRRPLPPRPRGPA